MMKKKRQMKEVYLYIVGVNVIFFFSKEKIENEN